MKEAAMVTAFPVGAAAGVQAVVAGAAFAAAVEVRGRGLRKTACVEVDEGWNDKESSKS